MGVEESTLPPAGVKRQEELKKRKDQLDKKGEELAASLEIESTDPASMEPDQEILRDIDELAVSRSDPLYKYCWVNTWGNGRFVTAKTSRGWQVVQGDMEEAKNCLREGEGTFRRVGDTILMRLRVDRYEILERKKKKKRQMQEDSVTSVLIELGDRHKGKGVIVHADPDEKLLMKMSQKARAQNISKGKFNDMVRHGTIPGAETGR